MLNAKTMLYAKKLVDKISNVESNVVTNKENTSKATSNVVSFLKNRTHLTKTDFYLRRVLIKTFKTGMLINYPKNRKYIDNWVIYQLKNDEMTRANANAVFACDYVYCNDMNFSIPLITPISVVNFVEGAERLKEVLGHYMNDDKRAIRKDLNVIRDMKQIA